MTYFPKPISLPDEVPKAREQRSSDVLRSAKWGIGLRLAIILMEFFGFYWFASSSLLMDAIASSLDIASSAVLIFCIKLASRPPDEDHPFGHGRYEPLAGLQLGLLLILIGGGMILRQILELNQSLHQPAINSAAWIIPFFAAVFLEICYRLTSRAAKKQHSPALAADAVHYRIDGVMSLFATAALAVGALIPTYSVLFDQCGALAIALLMIGLGIHAALNNLNQLMDKTPASNFFEVVRTSAINVKGVLDTEKIRIQVYGPDAHVDIDVEVDPELSVHSAHRISQEVRAEIQKAWPSVRDVTVHIEPYYPNDH